MTHDRLFKELLISFFYEFLELFFADLANQIDRSHPPVFLDKETFGANRREKDLVARVRFHSGEACFIVHIEHEAQNNRNFPQRMHLYFARLLERYGPPIYPIAVFSRRSRKPREGCYQLFFGKHQILDFRYFTLELALLRWDLFRDHPNPVASALMARMNVDPADRPRVKVECLRMLANLRVDPARSILLSRFIDAYLDLNEDEVRIFNQDLETLPQEERQAVMRMTTSWEEKGRQEGRQEGLERLRTSIKLILRARFGESAEPLISRLARLDTAALDILLERLSAGANLSDLDA